MSTKKLALLLSLFAGPALNNCAQPSLENAVNLSLYMPKCPSFNANFLCQTFEEKDSKTACSYSNLFGIKTKSFRRIDNDTALIIRYAENDNSMTITLKKILKDGSVEEISKNISNNKKYKMHQDKIYEIMKISLYLLDKTDIPVTCFNRSYSDGGFIYEYPSGWSLRETEERFYKAEEILYSSMGLADLVCGDFWNYTEKMYKKDR